MGFEESRRQGLVWELNVLAAAGSRGWGDLQLRQWLCGGGVRC